MDKRVNVKVKRPITRFNPPLKHDIRHVTMTTEQIRICLLEHAIVEEILDDNSIIRLDFSNYDTDNNPTKEEVIKEAIPDNEQSGNDLKDIENNKLTKKQRRELRRKQYNHTSDNSTANISVPVKTEDIEA